MVTLPVRSVPGPDEDRSRPQPRRTSRALLILSILLLLSLITTAWLIAGRIISSRSSSVDESATPSAFRVFWRAFTSGPDAPWIIFSNGAFVGRPETGLRYFDPGRDSREAISDHYTGVGEVLAVYDLNQVFTQLHHQVRVKRGSLFSLDDAQSNNLIFVGSPAENLSLLDIPSTHHFVFITFSIALRSSAGWMRPVCLKTICPCALKRNVEGRLPPHVASTSLIAGSGSATFKR